MATDRRSEAIWIESKGYWQIKVQKNGERKAFTSSKPGRKGKHEAEGKADKWLESGTKEMRFSEAWDEFLRWQKSHNGSGNFTKYECLGRLYLLPVVGTRRLSSISPAQWQRCIDAGAANGLSRRSCTNIRQTITTFLSHARLERWECDQVLPGDLKIPNSAPPAAPKRVLQPDDIRTLFSCDTIEHYGRAVPAHYIHAWRMLVATGLRRGELCGLRDEDVHDGLLTIRRSVNTANEITLGKNDNARRTMVLTSVAQSILADQRAMLLSRNISSPWLFPDPFGERADPNSLYKHWLTYCRQHGFSLSLHELRHTFVSLNKSDLPLELLKATVGHSSSMDTIGIYGHLIDGDRERAAEIIDSVLHRVLSPVEP